MSRRLIPLADRVLVRRAATEAKSAGGIILPETAAKKNEGVVVEVGPGAVTRDGTKIPMNVSVGQKVLLPEYGGHTVKVGDDEFHLFRDEDILAIIEE